MENLDPQSYARQRLRDRKLAFRWDATAGPEWRECLRSELAKSIGLPNDLRVPLDLRVVSEVAFETYSRKAITFSTREGLRAFGYLLIPKGQVCPGPAVICVPGHGTGVDALVGESTLDYQNQFAIQCVEQGFVTLALEPISFGHRKGASASGKDSSCVADSMAALMLGESMIGWRTHEAIIAVNLLQSLPEVDSARIGIMGISGGGLVALWASCFDERISATVVSGYFNTFFDSILSIEHCVDNFAPGLANIVEMPDMVSLIAPRRLFVESGSEDPIFPAAVFEQACQRAREIYAAFGAPTHFDCDLFPGDHLFCGRNAIPRLKEWLSEPC